MRCEGSVLDEAFEEGLDVGAQPLGEAFGAVSSRSRFPARRMTRAKPCARTRRQTLRVCGLRRSAVGSLAVGAPQCFGRRRCFGRRGCLDSAEATAAAGVVCALLTEGGGVASSDAGTVGTCRLARRRNSDAASRSLRSRTRSFETDEGVRANSSTTGSAPLTGSRRRSARRSCEVAPEGLLLARADVAIGAREHQRLDGGVRVVVERAQPGGDGRIDGLRGGAEDGVGLGETRATAP